MIELSTMLRHPLGFFAAGCTVVFLTACFGEPSGPTQEPPIVPEDTVFQEDTVVREDTVLYAVVRQAVDGSFEAGDFAPTVPGMQWTYKCTDDSNYPRLSYSHNKVGLYVLRILETTDSTVTVDYHEDGRIVVNSSAVPGPTSPPPVSIDSTYVRDTIMTMSRNATGVFQHHSPFASRDFISMSSLAEQRFEGRRVLSWNDPTPLDFYGSRITNYVSGVGLVSRIYSVSGNGWGERRGCELQAFLTPALTE